MYKQTTFFIMLIASLSYQMFMRADQSNFHQQLNAAILKNVKVENPSEKEQTLINTAKAFHDFGTPLNLSQPENWHALLSVDFFSVLARHNHTQTASGYRMLQQQCSVSMTDDIAILKSRQELIQFLDQNPDLLEQLSKILERSSDAEQKFLNLFKEVEASAQRHYFSSKLFSRFNENSAAMEASIRYDSTIPTAMLILLFLEIPIIRYCVEDFIAQESTSNFISILGKATYKSLVNIPENQKQQIQMLEMVLGSHAAAVTITTAIDTLVAYGFYRTFQDAKELFDIIYEKQQDLIVISNLIKSLKAMQHILEENEQLAKFMPTEYAKLTELFDQENTQTSADLKSLVSNLLSSSFQGTGSYLLSKQGKILATHHALVRIKGELVPYLEAFGQIDAYLATVKLYEHFKDHASAKFCLPSYITHESPVFIAQNFWHPLIDADKVVCNDLSMGNQNSHANLIITGPNAGGKTTALTALIINIIFAQTLGIAPSETLSITPFTKIHSSIDITTNLKEGLSLFAAEVDRAKKLKTSIISCTPEQKTFTIIDELFTGTAESVAANIGFQFATILGKMKNSMMIITTHIKHLTKLEKETDCFTNYKVADANINENGSVSYPFKLIQGISDQNIAVHMMQQEDLL